ncbi:MAG: endopeptidase La [Dictyoglomi bacterium]|nr:endopeptidase La [Dictyoglomota bacterium]HHV81095.1 endopeptidase La [bacterium]
MVVFPSTIVPVYVGRDPSVRAIELSSEYDRNIFVLTQKDNELDDINPSDLYDIGTVGEIIQTIKLPDGSYRAVIEAKYRAKVLECVYSETLSAFIAKVEKLEDIREDSLELEALSRIVLSKFDEYIRLNKDIPEEASINLEEVRDEPDKLVDIIASNLPIRSSVKQDLLSVVSPKERLLKLAVILERELKILRIEEDIQVKVQREVEETQREYYLRAKLKVIQEELGEKEDSSGASFYKDKIKLLGLSEDTEDKLMEEADRLNKVPPFSPESGVIKTYLDWIIGLPWGVYTKDKLNLKDVRATLDKNHYGLQEVKERIIEYLAVKKYGGTRKSPILCFVGPPGVGKTSLAQSISTALGRNFVRISLGGIRDEAEIRGHRRTYVGALPGRIIQGMKQARSSNPVFLLDEIDKLGIDFRGDPASALLEVLDPEQNKNFSDHYLEIPYNLSQVFFITTANTTQNIPPALLDRMEILDLNGYTEEEKLNIASRFLIPRLSKEHNINRKNIPMKEDIILKIIREYTREAGVRNLERELAKIFRKVVVSYLEGKKGVFKVDEESLIELLGPPRFLSESIEKKPEVGLANGLAWTEAGGEVLPIEVIYMKGKGNLILTGQLGDVMRESAQAAFSFIKNRSVYLDITHNFSEIDVHIHIPKGAIPKDGPSAGITMASALASSLSGIPLRQDVAMTGEITVRGRVLPVGGIKEKLLAAYSAGIREVIIPRENESDLSKIPDEIKKNLIIRKVSHMDEVFPIIFYKEDVLERVS